MSAFAFRTTFKPTGDQQKDAITHIEVMQERAVKAFVSWMSSQERTDFLTTLQEITTELDSLLYAVESHTPVFRKKAGELETLLAHYKTLL
ncbi:hypothetical protein AB2I82_24730 (plasmid) [Escherichia coli]